MLAQAGGDLAHLRGPEGLDLGTGGGLFIRFRARAGRGQGY